MLEENSTVDPQPISTPAAPETGVDDPFWNYSDLFIMVALTISAIVLCAAGAAAIAKMVPALKADPIPLALPSQTVFYVLVYLAFRLIFNVRYGRPVFTSLGWRPTRMPLLWMIIGGVALAFGVEAIAMAFHTPKIETPIDQLPRGPFSTAFFIILAVVLGPASEELGFRGFLQPLLSKSLGLWAGILVTAVLFGALHGPEYKWTWQYLLAISLAGAAFGWVRAHSGSIISSTVMHGTFNLVAVVSFFIAKNLKH